MIHIHVKDLDKQTKRVCSSKYDFFLNVRVAQLYLTLCDPMKYSQSDSSVHKILQARTQE